MTVYIIAGIPGVGKSSQIFNVANVYRPTRWASFETKDKRFLEKFVKNEQNQPQFEWTLIAHNHPPGHIDLFGKIDEYTPDPVKTLDEFEIWVHESIKKKPKTIVVDGISDIRDFVKERWIYEDNLIRIAQKLKPRQAIGEQNKAAWGEINDIVRGLLKPLIEYGYESGADIFFTAQMKDKYIDGNVVGEEPDIKKWIEHEAEVVMIFHKDKDQRQVDSDKYWVYCDKIPAWADSKESKFSVELRKGDGLLEVLSLHGLTQ